MCRYITTRTQTYSTIDSKSVVTLTMNQWHGLCYTDFSATACAQLDYNYN